MNENNINQKDDIKLHHKVHSINISSSIGVSKQIKEKNSRIKNKFSLQIDNFQNILSEGNIFSKNKKISNISLTHKSTSNNIKICKTFNKDCTNNSTKAILSKKNKLKISLTFSGVPSNKKIFSTKKRKSLNLNFNNNNIIQNANINDIKNIHSTRNSKEIKINTIFKPKTNRSRDTKKNKVKKRIKEENDIYNFTTDECDENINESFTYPNSRKHYSLTNPSILPCIPFANPFNNNNNNNNITDNNEKKLNHVNSLNINNKSNEMRKKFILMEKNYRENLDIINVFQDNENNEESEKEDDENVKLNISDLDIDLNQMNQDLEERNLQQNYKKSSFIQFNNNLSLQLATEKSNNTPSYMLALCPKLFLTKNKKDLIKENYAVNEPISEEVDSDSKTPKNSIYKISFEENNTKYSTKDKNSDRNKKYQEFDSEDVSNDEENKKNITTIENNEEIRISKNKYPKKNKKIIKDNIRENKNANTSKKRDKIRKKINLNEINIELGNTDNLNINKDANNNKKKKNNYFISIKNASSHYSNNTINNTIYNDTENNISKNKYNKINKLKNLEINERHQKAKSFLPDINISSLFLYETIQNNSSTINNSYNKNKKIMKINYKPNDYRNKILDKGKKVVDILNSHEIKEETQAKIKQKNNNNIYNTSNSNTNINNNKNLLKKKTFGQNVKSPKHKVNPFLSNFSEAKDKSIYNNELNYTLTNNEFK